MTGGSLPTHHEPSWRCGGNDRPDISQGLPELYLALARLHVSAELHIYAGVGHGFGVRKTNPAPVSGWTSLFLEWMNAQGLLETLEAVEELTIRGLSFWKIGPEVTSQPEGNTSEMIHRLKG